MNIHSSYRHTKAYTPSLGFVADSMSVLTFLVYNFLFVILKNTGSAKIISLLYLLSCSFSLPLLFSPYLHDFNDAFLRSKTIHPMSQPPLRPILKYKIVINPLLLIIYLSKAKFVPFYFQLLPFLKYAYHLEPSCSTCTGFIHVPTPLSHHKNSHCPLNIVFIWRNITVKVFP